jgi:hypothetical protein
MSGVLDDASIFLITIPYAPPPCNVKAQNPPADLDGSPVLADLAPVREPVENVVPPF